MHSNPEHHEHTSDLTSELVELADLKNKLALKQALQGIEDEIVQPELLEGVIPYVKIDQVKLEYDLAKTPEEYLAGLEKNKRLDDLYGVDYTSIIE